MQDQIPPNILYEQYCFTEYTIERQDYLSPYNYIDRYQLENRVILLDWFFMFFVRHGVYNQMKYYSLLLVTII
jgi:hypothetical protein